MRGGGAVRGHLSVSGRGAGAVRVLALHSFRTSGAIFAAQMRRAGWLLPEGGAAPAAAGVADGTGTVEVVFLDAPFEASGKLPPRIAEFFPDGPYLEWWNASDDGTVYEGLEDTLAYVDDFVAREGPFDGVIGFSQGGTLAALLCALQERRRRLASPAAAPAELTPEDFRFCICVCGLRSRLREHRQLYESGIRLPSLHFLGRADSLTAHSRRLVESFEDPLVVEHGRGHVVPPLAEGDGREALGRFLGAHGRRPQPSL